MKIVFTSCIRYEAFPKQPSWDIIRAQNPDYLFLLGDTIYMDYGLRIFSDEYNGSPEEYTIEKFKERMEQKYRNQFEKVQNFKELVRLMRDKGGFYAIWDDHDFAWNEAKGAMVSNEKKAVSNSLFHQYLNCSTNRPHTYYSIDTPMARVIFLDNRTDAMPEGQDARLISEEQFTFIESNLKHELRYTLICGGLTLSKGHENWSKYPSQLRRFCELIAEVPRLLFLAGDIHCNAFVPSFKLANSNLLTPPQLISSGLAVNYLGLGLSFDNCHNWAILDLNEHKAEITFYKNDSPQGKLSNSANSWIMKHYHRE